jgi:DNA-directed RNA polymerase subunit omega
MILPDINDLLNKVDSRYTLVVATAKRARQLVDGASKITRFNSDKAVTIAIHEIAEGKIRYTRERNTANNDDSAPVYTGGYTGYPGIEDIVGHIEQLGHSALSDHVDTEIQIIQ